MKPITLTLLNQLTGANLNAIIKIKEALQESNQHLDQKLAELEANEYLAQNGEWCEFYEYELGYHDALEFCLEQLIK